TVYEAEALGLVLAARLLAIGQEQEFPVEIYVDNQAAIQSGDVLTTKPGHYLIDHFRRAIAKIRKENPGANNTVTVCWISGHDGVEGNKRADMEAKMAVQGARNNSTKRRLPKLLRKDPLPLSISALKQHQKETSAKRWMR
ncbi:hypothetical protein BU15DRAFT_15617, partial [Melanogaster broomeanus]